MGVLLYVETQRQVWKHAEFKDFERHLVALSEKDAVRKLFTLYRLKKKRKFVHFFLDIRMSKMSVSLRRNAHFQITPNENLKNQMFFSRPWWLKLVFRWGETPNSTLESCACHRKMIMTLKCPLTKSHKYHVSTFWRENLKIKIGNPSQGAVSTAYLVLVFIFIIIFFVINCHYYYNYHYHNWIRSPERIIFWGYRHVSRIFPREAGDVAIMSQPRESRDFDGKGLVLRFFPTKNQGVHTAYIIILYICIHDIVVSVWWILYI